MKNTKYYTELIGNMVETQCMSDLRNGETTIKDVPFEFRDFNAYSSAHKFARGIVDEKERYYQLWKIMACLESDISDLQIAKDIRDLNKTNLKPTEEIPQDTQDGLATRKSAIISCGRLQNLLRLIFAISKWHKQCENMELQHQKLKRKLGLRFLKNPNFLIWTND